MNMYWFKLSTDLFNSKEFRVIEKTQNADLYEYVWLRLLCLAAHEENDGIFTWANGKHITAKQFADIFNKTELDIETAFKVFSNLGMITMQDGIVTIPSWKESQTTTSDLEAARESNRKRQARYRERQKTSNADSNARVTQTVTPE